MRKLTQKATAFLYEKEAKKKGNSLREMAAKKEHEDKIRRARSSNINYSIVSPTSRPSAKMSATMNKSVRKKVSSIGFTPKTVKFKSS